MERVDAESDARDDPGGYVEARDRGEARHVLLGSPKIGLVATKQDVRSAVDQDDGVEVEGPHEVPVAFPHGSHPQPIERVDADRSALPGQKPREGALGEVSVASCCIGVHGVEGSGEPSGVGPAEEREREVRQEHLLAQPAQALVDREARVHIESAAGAGHEDPPALLEARRKSELVHVNWSPGFALGG
jgi:hypothetical protein